MPLPPSPIGFDASVLINFCAVGRLDVLLTVVPPPRCVTDDVMTELEDPATRGAVESAVQQGELLIVELHKDEIEQWAAFTLRLDAGESATLAAALYRGWSVAMDEIAARREAERLLGLNRITGTMGLLAAGVEAGSLTRDEGNEVLQGMIAAGYWAPVADLGEL